MFTGLIEKKALIKARDFSAGAGKLLLETETPFTDLKRGESIAVNGACLTLETFAGNELTFHVLEESLKKTNLEALPLGTKVNLERALAMGDRLGGHIVSGHIDSTSKVKSWTAVGDDWELAIYLPEELKPFIVEKGSIAIDGVSLTIVNITPDSFSVHLIPTTCDDTCLRERVEGAMLNLEADLIGKYVVKQLGAWLPNGQGSDISMETLVNSGWD